MELLRLEDGDGLVQSLLHNVGSQNLVQSGLNTSKDADSTTSLGNLFLCLMIVRVKDFFPLLCLSRISFVLIRAYCFISFYYVPLWRAWFCLLPSIKSLYTVIRSPDPSPSLSQAKQFHLSQHLLIRQML